MEYEKSEKQTTVRIDELIKDICNRTDLWPWYWLAYGDKCYAFAVVEAFPIREGLEFPPPGSLLEIDEDDPKVWVGINGTKMLINTWISDIQEQNGDAICKFIAGTHAELLKKYFDEMPEVNNGTL